eukprot:scaffold1981_cov345-Pinguiococcus_pyrenoidosus.AAC.14
MTRTSLCLYFAPSKANLVDGPSLVSPEEPVMKGLQPAEVCAPQSPCPPERLRFPVGRRQSQEGAR